MGSILHKDLEQKVEKLKYKKLELMQPKIKNNWPNFQFVNKPSRISPHEVLQSWLIDTVYHLSVKTDKGKESRGLKGRRAYKLSSPEKEGWAY